jgi:hypothetical protein
LEALDAAAFALATPQKSEEFALATEDLERVYRQHREVSTEIHFLEEKKGALEIVLKEAIGERAGLTGNGWAVTWRQARATEVTDWKLAAQAAGVLPQVVATYTSTKAGSRRFVVRDGGAND